MRRQQKLPLGRGGCVECHNLKPQCRAAHPSRGTSLRFEIEPVLMTPVWFESAIFNHTAHRALDCAACHCRSFQLAGKRRSAPPAGYRRVCGVPFRGAGPAIGPASRSEHGLHGVSRLSQRRSPRHGLGAAERRGTAALSIEQFRSGDGALHTVQSAIVSTESRFVESALNGLFFPRTRSSSSCPLMRWAASWGQA